jgi:hypothetical protein
LPFHAEKDETVVSYIVGLGPSTVELNKPLTVTLMHSGPGEKFGYETIVKAFNQERRVWEEKEGTGLLNLMLYLVWVF